MRTDGSMPIEVIYKNEPRGPYLKSVFKFFPLGINSLDAFASNYFWLSSPNSFNDPFDFNTKLIDPISNKVKNEYSKVGISCFSTKKDDVLMWGHYAKGFDGFAVKIKGLPRQKAFGSKEFKLQYCGEVAYVNKVIESKKIRSEFRTLYLSIIKHKRWSYEKEVRLVYIGPEGKERKWTYDPNIVEAVYIGFKVFEDLTPERSLLLNTIIDKYPRLPVYYVEPRYDLFKVKFERIPKKKLLELCGRVSFGR
ncbi:MULTISPECIES: DUF2971 domain-containing protein [unclassified Imperialibacter]|uniref:DUF2971 domain-containing protein n=1 Tax=unclassified Imperialibacter TaxID=2629706 RepID=UPI001869C352|nr:MULTISPECIES: DUF2971 domain-containing protein [unclassified Imperialibacter]